MSSHVYPLLNDAVVTAWPVCTTIAVFTFPVAVADVLVLLTITPIAHGYVFRFEKLLKKGGWVAGLRTGTSMQKADTLMMNYLDTKIEFQTRKSLSF